MIVAAPFSFAFSCAEEVFPAADFFFATDFFFADVFFARFAVFFRLGIGASVIDRSVDDADARAECVSSFEIRVTPYMCKFSSWYMAPVTRVLHLSPRRREIRADE